jgi:hypothetical protein
MPARIRGDTSIIKAITGGEPRFGGTLFALCYQQVSGWPVAGLDQGQKSCLTCDDGEGCCSIQHHNYSDQCDRQDTCEQDKPKQRVFEDIEAVVHDDDLFI